MLISVNKKKSRQEIDEIVQAIKSNNGYCPCKLEQTVETKCLCQEMRVNHICECGLYVYKGE